MRPEPALLVALALWTALGAAATVWPALLPAVLGAGIGLSLVAVCDLRAGRRLAVPGARRIVPGALAQGVWTDVVLELENDTRSLQDLELFDHHPPHGETRGMPRRVRLPPGDRGVLRYRFRALSRGAGSFAGVELFQRSPARLWRLRRFLCVLTPVKVFPDFRTVQRYAILAVDDARGPSGIHKRRRRGEGQELLQLREYREGDSLRQIDWKATSRRDRVISRQYEDERNQQLVFLLDCGWRMRAVDRGEAHFDRALNSLLLLTYVAVRQGDAVGLLTLGEPRRWLPPQRRAGLKTMLGAVYDLEARSTHPDFTAAAVELMARQRRRALVVILSNLRDEDGEEAAAAVRLLRRRHLVLFASLREASLDAARDAAIDDFQDALRTSAAHHFMLARRLAHERLRGRGVSTLDVTPAELPQAIVNRYLEIKRSGAL